MIAVALLVSWIFAAMIAGLNVALIGAHQFALDGFFDAIVVPLWLFALYACLNP